MIRIQGFRIIQGRGSGNLALEALLEVELQVPVRLVFLLPAATALGLRFSIECLAFRVSGFGFRIQGLELRVRG